MKRINLFLIYFCTIGAYLTAQINLCVGEQGKVSWHYFKNVQSNSFDEMTFNPKFPNSPDAIKSLYSTKSPIFYDNYFGARIQGYIRVPQNTTATFNVTAEDRCRLYLSTDANPANKQLVAFTASSTAVTQHTKEANQTSGTITLNANTYYYFDFWYVSGGYADQANLYWKTPLVSNTVWNNITTVFLYDIGCITSCPPAGTPCNDNNGATAQDIQDGNCQCFGKPATNNSCIGDRGKVQVYHYMNIPGTSVATLTNNSKFPAMPTTSTMLTSTLSMPGINRDSFGSFVRGYISVPVSGTYKFNITGDDNTRFYLSSNDLPANKTNTVIEVTGWTTPAEFNKYTTQTSANINLVQGQYYYFELLQKEGGGGDHFSLQWQTPFNEANVWKKITTNYLYNHTCEIICVPINTPCEDGNPYTNNDKYNASCNCIGTPCSGPDCTSPIASYVPFEKCNVTDQLDNRLANNWLSCSKTTNPNPLRPSSHWVKYDLTKRHKLISSKFWNYNVPSETTKGFEIVALDYSLDGVNWTALDTFNLALATGTSGYDGQDGPDLTGIYARYLLITSVDNSTACRGMGKVAFKTVVCPVQNTPCNDGDALSLDDRYDNNCECRGKKIGENDCIVQNLMLGDSILSSRVFSARDYVTSLSQIDVSKRVSLVAGKAVTLLPGFESAPNALFMASIDLCPQPIQQTLREARQKEVVSKREKTKLEKLIVSNDLRKEVYTISFYLPSRNIVYLRLYDSNGKEVSTLSDTEYLNKGFYEKSFMPNKLDRGVYTVKYTYGGAEVSKDVVIE
jgi:hypothetical protein